MMAQGDNLSINVIAQETAYLEQQLQCWGGCDLNCGPCPALGETLVSCCPDGYHYRNLPAHLLSGFFIADCTVMYVHVALPG